MPVPMIDLKAQYALIRDDVNAAVARVLESQQFRGGAESEGFEAELAAFGQAKHAIALASGTDALLLMFKALGIGPGDEVITTPFSFFATAGALVNAGATPVFADILPGTFNLNPEAVRAAITPQTKAILPVHLYGQCADMDAFRSISSQAGVHLVEDAAQALGASYKDQPLGTGTAGAALSFYPTKNLGAAGEGGAVLTNDDAIAERLKLLRCHGSAVQYEHQIVGTNSHLHAIQAAVLRVKLRHLADWNEARRAHACYYFKVLGDLPGVVLPEALPGAYHVYHQFVIRVPRRDACVALFKERGIGCGVFYPKPLHLQDCFQQLSRALPCPEAERASREVLALPMFAEMTRDQQDEVAAALRDHLAAG
ncbi:MAG: aminotransferase class V-fold PLP-dependent enzyme [Candidatus Hydrogenedens sp.]|nr:aminotransferase class V-fold PLP-dependent enzyme [Candidatus Hydrogenedens sp.]